ncbi:Methyltranfer-dom domain-containing protein [Fusobacterium necrophorum subsp. funduliforme]|uniref:class I SAM-dependent methyltransferase n=1 Tax=Fusobacterium necrophorum TaxID=859 RepID=UPI00370E7936
MTAKEAMELLESLIQTKKLIKIVLSDKEADAEWDKVLIRPVKIKEQDFMQFEKFKNNKSYHFNMEAACLYEEISISVKQFKQAYIHAEGKDYHLSRKGEKYFSKESENSCCHKETEHNKSKKYLLPEGKAIDFLVYLGVMSKEGRVYKHSYAKYRQINKYLEFIENTIKELQEKKWIEKEIRILDFGCGKSYLTFALYYYLREIKKINFRIIGLDLKEDVMKHCNRIAKELGYTNLEFLTGNIQDFEELKEVDLVFSLHACDNATDYSILKALEMNAKAILAVPCCQHKFFYKINKNKKSPLFETMNLLGKHGIILERFSSLATDAYRSAFLELKGYRTQVMEFIDMEHTPKNILIKAIYEGRVKNEEKKREEYQKFLDFLGIDPILQ